MGAPNITESWVRAVAPNAAAMRNGQELSARFLTLCVTEDHSLLFGDCPGSGAEPYAVRVDFAVPESPAYHCTCPSRQTPCKHVLGLMLAYAEKPERFSPIPVEAVPRRARTAPMRRRTAPSGRGNAKKTALQIEGLDMALGMAEGLVREGLGTLSGKKISDLRAQNRTLGNHYIPGVQTKLARILHLLSEGLTRDAPRRAAFEELAVFSLLCRRAHAYFAQKLNGSDETDAALETWCGRVWHLTELESMGLCSRNARLLQLAFASIDNPDSAVVEDTGYWAAADGSGVTLCLTQTLRPHQALAHVREEDSCHGIVCAPKLYRYPAGLRVRWDEFSIAEPVSEDFHTVLSLAEPLAPVLKRLRREAQSPCGERFLPAVIGLGALETDADGGLWLCDTEGGMLPLDDAPDAPSCLLPLALDASHEAVFILLALRPDGQPAGQALSLLSPDGVTRIGG